MVLAEVSTLVAALNVPSENSGAAWPWSAVIVTPAAALRTALSLTVALTSGLTVAFAVCTATSTTPPLVLFDAASASLRPMART